MELIKTREPEWFESEDVQAMLAQIEEERRLSADPEFPEESFDAFSEAPLNFEEMTASLRNDLEEVYTLTGKFNRLSPDYPAACRILEKMIRRMGSFCVTKAVLEQKGFAFPSLKETDLTDLYCMVSFNFRKTRTAYHDGKQLKNCADLGLLGLECRWVDLADQLKATAEKISLIRSGKVSADSMLERARMFEGEKETRRRDVSSGQRGSSGKTRSLPVLGSVARRMIAERKAAQKKTSRLPKTGMFREARPFKPSKEMLEMIRMDEEREEAERKAAEKEALERFSRGEVSVHGSEIAPKTALPERLPAAGKAEKKSKKQIREEFAAARRAERETEELLRRTKEICGRRFEAMKAGKKPPDRDK